MSDRPTRGGDAQSTNLRGIELADRGWYEEALKEFARAIELDPNSPFPRINRASVYLDQGRPREALEDLLEAVRLSPGVADVRYHLGLALSRHGSNLALSELRAALQKDPHHLDAQIQIGVVYAERGEWQKAEAALTAALDMEPSDPVANHEMGVLLLDRGRMHEAIAHLRQASTQWPDDNEILLDLGNAYIQAGFFDQGEKCLRKVLASAPGDLYAHYNLAALFSNKGQREKSLKHLRLAMERDPSQVTDWLADDQMFADLKDDPDFILLTRPGSTPQA